MGKFDKRLLVACRTVPKVVVKHLLPGLRVRGGCVGNDAVHIEDRRLKIQPLPTVYPGRSSLGDRWEAAVHVPFWRVILWVHLIGRRWVVEKEKVRGRNGFMS